MDKRMVAYDEFGPWLTRIEDELHFPDEFEMYKDEIMGSKFAFKIPIRVERRNASPDMVLYDTVIAVNDKKISYYRWNKVGIVAKEVLFSDIIYFRKIRDELVGELKIATNVDEIDIKYPTNPMGMLDQAVRLIRKAIVKENKTIEISGLKGIAEQIETPLFRNIMNYDFKDEALIPFVQQKRFEFASVASPDVLDNLFNVPVLQATVFFTNGKELVILNKPKDVKGTRELDLGDRMIFIPIELIRSVNLDEDDTYRRLASLNIKVVDKIVRVRVAADFDLATLKNVLFK